MEKSSNYILELVLKAYPDKLPLNEIDSFELGRLMGQQDVVKYMKEKLKVTIEKEQEIK